jgi:hypothetical protein
MIIIIMICTCDVSQIRETMLLYKAHDDHVIVLICSIIL